MAVKHTIRRSTINAIAQQVDPNFAVEHFDEQGERQDYKLFIETDGDFAHVRFAARGSCPECSRYEDLMERQAAIRELEENR